MKSHDVFGICNALYDLHVEATDEILAQAGLSKGAMHLVTHEQQRAVVPSIYERIVSASPGGSGANTMLGIAMLGGNAVFAGHTGMDDHARFYCEGLEAKGVKADLSASEGDTGICVVLVTPDAERTMLTYLGRSQFLAREHIPLDDLASSKYLYVTAYMWDTDVQKDAVQYAMHHARQNDVKVVLNLSDPFCATRHKEELRQLVRSNVDVVIGNSEEVSELTDCATSEEAGRVLAEWCQLAVVTHGAQGSKLFTEGTRIDVDPSPVDAVDSTGAGDMYAAGFVYGLAKGVSLDGAGRLASVMAAKVVGQFGPRLQEIEPGLVQETVRGLAAAP